MTFKTPFTIAVDGPAAAGKGTISKAVAAHYGVAHLDTGLLYRAVAARVLAGEDPIDAAQILNEADLKRSDLRTAEVAQTASKVAVIAEVRRALLAFQRSFARRPGGAVLDGRDIGTVVCPEAEAKLFVTASAEVRAERRFRELVTKQDGITFEVVLQEVRERDERDRNRSEAPMIAAPDAHHLDTSHLDIDTAIARAITLIDRRATSITPTTTPG